VAKLRIIFDITKELNEKMRGYSVSVTDSPAPGVSLATANIVTGVSLKLNPPLARANAQLGSK